jgi:glycosyltransferase EpsD
MKKVLFVANIAKHVIRFHLPYLKWFQEKGYETHVASNGTEDIPYCDVQHNIPIVRSPFSPANIKAHFILKKIIDQNQYTIIHGHTPMGGVLSRTAAFSARKKGTKVIYTAHGFHFYKGAPLLNWLLYFPMEMILSLYTDAIITINTEDFEVLTKYHFRCKYKFQIPGIGVDINKLKLDNGFCRLYAREKEGITENDFVLIYIAEFIDRKNHRFIIDAAAKLKKKIPNLKILFAGRGELMSDIEIQIQELQLQDVVKLLGFRSDIASIISLSDVGISASKHEGLPLNIAEEMFCGLPVLASIDRGHKEMIDDGYNGFLFQQNNIIEFVEKILYLYTNSEQKLTLGRNAYNSIQRFSLENSLKEMSTIYQKILSENV